MQDISDDELRARATRTVKVMCAQHKCGPGCQDRNHRRDVAYCLEFLQMLGLKK